MKRFLVPAAIALVCLTNIGALTLGALNRRTITTDLTLTERELRLVSPRSSVTLLRVEWMQPSPEYFRDEFVSRAGFTPPTAADLTTYAQRQPQRQVYVALEYDGLAWERYRDTILRREPPYQMTPITPEQREQQLRAREQAVTGHTRLFAIDIDRDASRLRARHPDLSRVLITQGRASVMAHHDEGPFLAVSVNQVVPNQINLPRPFSETLRRLIGHQVSRYGDSLLSGPRYSVRLRYGRFHEPWVEHVEQLE